MDTVSPMDETELIELEDEIAGENEHALKEDDFTFDISVSLSTIEEFFLSIIYIENLFDKICRRKILQFTKSPLMFLMRMEVVK